MRNLFSGEQERFETSTEVVGLRMLGGIGHDQQVFARLRTVKSQRSGVDYWRPQVGQGRNPQVGQQGRLSIAVPQRTQGTKSDATIGTTRVAS